MTARDIEVHRDRLRGLLDRLHGDDAALTDEALHATGGGANGNLSDTPFHLADHGTENFEQQMSISLLENKRRVEEEIGAAFGRIDRGTFGLCERCGTEIPSSRLNTLPYARYCVACAQLLEKDATAEAGPARVY